MAGGILKSFGGLFLIVGIALFLVGLVVAVYAAADERDNQSDAGVLGPDGERSEQNEALVMAGAAGMGVGLVSVLLGAIFMAGGGARAQRRLVKAVEATGPAALAKQPKSLRRAPTPVVGAAAKSTMGGRQAVMLGLGVFGFFLILAVIAVTLGSDGNPFGREDESLLSEQYIDGSVSRSITVLGISQGQETTAWPIDSQMVDASARIDLNWTPTAFGAQRLVVELQVDRGHGWETEAQTEGGPALALEAEIEAGFAYQLLVTPADNGATDEQPFNARVQFYADS